MDLTQALKDTENSLRDFIATVLEKKIGGDWMSKCGVTAERLKQWQDRKTVEGKRQTGGVVEPRLIYYADFYDIKTILEKNWDKFSEAFGEWKTMKVYLNELETLRDPDAHRRELLPHQKNLAAGIAGEIRTKLIRYRSKLETSEDYFPRIESARDSLGNVWAAGSVGLKAVVTNQTLREGDVVDYVVTASDPMGQALEFRLVAKNDQSAKWQSDHSFSLRILHEHASKLFSVRLEIRSPRAQHAFNHFDDWVEMLYDVIPKK